MTSRSLLPSPHPAPNSASAFTPFDQLALVQPTLQSPSKQTNGGGASKLLVPSMATALRFRTLSGGAITVRVE